MVIVMVIFRNRNMDIIFTNVFNINRTLFRIFVLWNNFKVNGATEN